jgi:hypothetical protein
VGERGWRREQALAVAAAWSIALMVPFGWGVLERVRHPNPAWLMLPPLRGDRADVTAPLSAWCPYSEHGSASGCEWALAATGRQLGVDGYAFAGARCVSVAQVAQPSMHERMLAHLEATLGPMLDADAVLRRSGQVAGEALDLVVVAKGDDDAPVPLIGIDVDERDTSEIDRERVARLAAAELPEYWHLAQPHGAFPAMLTVWSEPMPAQRAYASQRGWGGTSGDPELKPIRLGDGQFAVSDLVPPVCPPRPDAAAAPPPACDGRLAFVVDGTSAEPSFQLTHDADAAEPTAFRFAAVSAARAGFDPRHDGLAVQVHAVHPRADLVEALLPPGPAWAEEAPGLAWRYHDGRGRAGGLTDVRVARVGPDASRLAWGVEARVEPSALSAPARAGWTTLGVTLTLDPQSDTPGACGEVFFPVGPGAGRCRLDGADEAIRCSVPAPAPDCAAEDVDGMIRCTVAETARAQDVYFARRGLYFSGACGDLPGVATRAGVSCTTAGSVTGFSVTALHAAMKQRCTLESATRDRGVECS